MTTPSTLKAAITTLLTSYHDFNLPYIEEISGAPSALEFLQHVRISRPVVFRGAAADWDALGLWDNQFLKETLKGRTIPVAETPGGNADAVVEQDGIRYFAKPHVETASINELLDYLTAPSSSSSRVRYAQSQDDNLTREFYPLTFSLPPTIPWATLALRSIPDAANLWIGNSLSTTALHKDNYENLFFQVRGQKHFVLLSPLEGICVRERELPAATFVEKEGELVLVRDEPAAVVRGWPTVDPDCPGAEGSGDEWWEHARPLRVSLRPGDCLYLPPMWYHKVAQTEDEEGLCVAVNYWYDMEYAGMQYSAVEFVRNVQRMVEVEEEREGKEE